MNRTEGLVIVTVTALVVAAVAYSYTEIRTTEIIETEQTKRCLSNNRWHLVNSIGSTVITTVKRLSAMLD